MKKTLTKTITLTACLAAIVCVATYAVAIPLPIGGYFNLGDIFVLLCGWLLGPLYGAFAAGLGSALADLFLGYVSYAPATLVVKGGVAFLAWGSCIGLKKLIKTPSLDALPRIGSAVIAELLMVAGYFVYEALVLQLGLGATSNLFGNFIQGLCGGLGGVIVIAALYPLPKIERMFPLLKNK